MSKVKSIALGLGLTFAFNAFAEEQGQNNTQEQVLNKVTVKAKGDEERKKVSLPLFSEDVKYIPQSVEVITKEVMEEQNSTTVKDALKNVTGITLNAGEGGAQGDGVTIRGFTSRSDFYLDGVRDFGHYTRDAFNVQKIDVFKGASSAKFGRGSTGGIVNQESKRAFLGDLTEFKLSGGTNNLKRGEADLNYAINETSAFRLNLMGHSENTAGRDVVQNERYGIAPTISFGLGTDLEVTLSYLRQAENNIPDYGLPFVNKKADRVSLSNYYGFESNFFKTEADVLTGNLIYKINQEFKVIQTLRYGNYKRNTITTAPRYTSGITVNRNQMALKSEESVLTSQTILNAKVWKNDVSLGLELTREASSPTRYSYTGAPVADLYNPNYKIPFSGVGTISSKNKTVNETVSVFLLDTLSLTEKLDVVVGGRFDGLRTKFTQEIGSPTSLQNAKKTDSMFSETLGLVYKFTPENVFYIMQGSSFNPSAENISLSAENLNLKPEKNNTIEAGIKLELLKDLETNFAIFQTTKTNARTKDLENPLLKTLQGEQRVRGFEAEVNYTFESFNIFGGYAYLDGIVVKSNNPLEQGNPMAHLSKHNFNFWANWNITDIWGAGLGGNYASRRNASALKDPNYVNGYFVLNGMVSYNLSQNTSLQLNVYNILNQEYFAEIAGQHAVPASKRYAVLSFRKKL